MRFLLLILAVLGLTGLACSSPATTESPDDAIPAPEGWVLVWHDEFNESGLPDSTKWDYDIGGHGWGNQELQYYTQRREKNARVEDGRLIIEAHREPFEDMAYTSARMVTRDKAEWTYGRFEVRAKLPSGRGTWPAIWMLAAEDVYGEAYWPDNGEIDIMEHVGFNPDEVHATVHTRAYHHSIGTQRGASMHVEDARTDFNVYAVEWSPEEIRAYIDDELYFTFANERLTDPDAGYEEWPFDQPFYLLLNIAAGGTWGGAEGIDENIWPQRMEIDYVRVFEQE